MGHWAEQYVGRPYIEDVFECVDLVILVNREQFKRELTLPGSRDHFGKHGHERYRAMTDQLAAAKDTYGERTDTPFEGDGVLLLSRGRMAHIGIYCLVGGEAYVLHCASNSKQTVLHRIRDIHLQGFGVEGFYRWK